MAEGLTEPLEFIRALSERVFEIYETTQRPSRRDCVVSVLVWLLSKSLHLTDAYLRSRSHMDLGHFAEVQSNDDESETLFSWFRLIAEDVLQALGDIENRSRIRADEFLVRSLVAEFISEQNKRGLTVPTDTAIEMFLRYWTHRPCSLRVQASLMKLTYHRNTGRKFGQVIRAEWMLQFSVIKSARDLDGFNFVVRFLRFIFFCWVESGIEGILRASLGPLLFLFFLIFRL